MGVTDRQDIQFRTNFWQQPKQTGIVTYRATFWFAEVWGFDLGMVVFSLTIIAESKDGELDTKLRRATRRP